MVKVCEMILGVIASLEQKHRGKVIIIRTSHADTLHIMQSIFSQEDPWHLRQHRFKNSEVIRELVNTIASE